MKRTKIRLISACAALALALTGCDAIGGGSPTEAQVGDRVSTSWFDYTITSAQAVENYEGCTAPVGDKLVVVDMTMTNTYDQPVPMFDTDFQLYWGDYGSDEMAFPLEPYCTAQLPTDYDLAVGETREGVLIYQVPSDVQDFTFAFLEVFDNGTEEGEEGDLFVTYFTAP